MQRTETAAVIETRLVHELHRRATALLATTLTKSPIPLDETRALRSFVVATLRHHHRSEDRDLWPIVARAAPDLAAKLESLSREHEQLDRQLDALVTSTFERDRSNAAVLAGELRDLVDEHLAHEEPILFPALANEVSEPVWDDFSARTVASAPAEGIHYLVALLDEVGPPDAVDVVLRHVPADARERLPVARELGRAALATLR